MTVFANGLQVACKAQSNKVLAAFPYVCMTPPQTPATPPGVPVPYPTFGMDSDTDKGTSTVKIGGEKNVTQKNLSYYTKCTGNEAGCAPMKNVVSHVNKGKEYAHAWSGNVRMDGEPISRFSDLSTNDHSSPMAGGPPMSKVSTATPPWSEEKCAAAAKEIEADLTRDKRVRQERPGSKKKGTGGRHGYLFQLAEQRCGEFPPGTDGWKNHEKNLKDDYAKVKVKIDLFMANCDLDRDLEIDRGGRKRDRNLKEAIRGIHTNDDRFNPVTSHLGENHDACGDLDDMRADYTLDKVMEAINGTL